MSVFVLYRNFVASARSLAGCSVSGKTRTGLPPTRSAQARCASARTGASAPSTTSTSVSSRARCTPRTACAPTAATACEAPGSGDKSVGRTTRTNSQKKTQCVDGRDVGHFGRRADKVTTDRQADSGHFGQSDF
jgi:hypothetical protein